MRITCSSITGISAIWYVDTSILEWQEYHMRVNVHYVDTLEKRRITKVELEARIPLRRTES